MITVTVSDGVLTASSTFQLAVTAVNDAPVVSAIAPQTTAEDQPLTVPFSVSDVETAAGSLTVQATSSNPTLVAASGIGHGGGGGSRTLILTPRPNEAGVTTIALIGRRWHDDDTADVHLDGVGDQRCPDVREPRAPRVDQSGRARDPGRDGVRSRFLGRRAVAGRRQQQPHAAAAGRHRHLADRGDDLDQDVPGGFDTGCRSDWLEHTDPHRRRRQRQHQRSGRLQRRGRGQRAGSADQR